MNPETLPIWVLSLGCPKNRVDTERLLGSLGLQLKTVNHIGKSRLVFINTCAFIEPATRESIRAILDVIEHIKRLRSKPLVVVAGCLIGRYGREELAKELPQVDVWLSTDQLEQWPEMVTQALGIANSTIIDDRILQAGLPYAWLKISDGCLHKCAFCAIPAIKGTLRSEPAEKILKEAKGLLSKGVKELILVAQDLTAWGTDLFRNSKNSSLHPSIPHNLATLVEKLALLPGLDWLRLLYLYPASLTNDLLHVIAEVGRPVLPYLDIPLQHSEPEILGKMGRPFLTNPRDLVEKIRKILPQAALRTTLIVGYPGETSEQFDRLCSFVSQARFHNLGVFTFHPEEGTLAAKMPEQIPEQIKEERKRIILDIQSNISAAILAECVGSRMQVMVDKSLADQWPGLCAGRVWFQAPEIDGITYVSGPGIIPRVMVECDIEGSHTYDLDALA